MHLDTELISSYVDNELSDPWKVMIEEHISNCEVCSKRVEKLKVMREDIKNASLTDEEIKLHQDRVLKYLENNVIGKRHSIRQIIHKIPIWIRSSIYVGLAFTLIFVFTFSNRNEYIPYVNEPTVIDSDNIIPIRYTDSYSSTKTLDDYSLEEIINNLSDRGYDVNLTYRNGIDTNFKLTYNPLFLFKLHNL